MIVMKWLMAAVFVLVLAPVLVELTYVGRIFPGVWVAGIDVGGMTIDRVSEKLRQELMPAAVIAGWGANQWKIEPLVVSFEFDIDQSALNAARVGRGKGWFNNWRERGRAFKERVYLGAIFTLDENRLTEAVASISATINIPAAEPDINVEKVAGIKKITVTLGENGQEVDEPKLAKKIKLDMGGVERGIIEIPIVRLLPKLSETEANEVAARAGKMLNREIEVKFSQLSLEWKIIDEEMVKWIAEDKNWKKTEIEAWGQQLALGVNRPAENAYLHFIRPGKVEEFKPARDGFEVQNSELTRLIIEALGRMEAGSQKEVVNLPVLATEPEVKTGEANDLGIKALIGRGESWFSGSITNRIYNLRKSAEELNGVLVAPGEVFSFNQAVGEVSAATGYKQAYIIKEGKTILGDGGGVCQVSSTLFRAILAAGLPIPERTAHAYRVHYYEEKYQVGFDATVFQPAPDFKFTNDTPAYILIQTEFDEKNKHLVFNLYGTSDGRKVETSKSRIWDQVPPPPDLYQDDPTLPLGKVVQTEHAAWGAKVAFDWKVTRGEEVLQERTFYSNYRTWQAVYLRGTKVN